MCRSEYCTHRRYAVLSNQTSWQVTGATTTEIPWTDWVQQATYASSTQFVWESWTTSTTATIYNTNSNVGWVEARPAAMAPPSAEALEAAARRRGELEARRALERTEVAERSAKARELLLSCLDEAQAAEFTQLGQFHVSGRSGKRYCIKHGRAGNISSPDTQGRTVNFCIHDQVNLPPEDTMLAQKLMIELEEEAFLRIANASLAY